jgi:hypothetical protein
MIEKANPSQEGDAKPRVLNENGIAGLPYQAHNQFILCKKLNYAFWS